MAKRYTLEEFKKLTQEDQVLAVAQENLRLYGTLVPPPEAQLHVQDHVCPNCGERGPVLKMFGVVFRGDVPKPQSWCVNCRGSKAARPGMYPPSSENDALGLEPGEREAFRKLDPEQRKLFLRVLNRK